MRLPPLGWWLLPAAFSLAATTAQSGEGDMPEPRAALAISQAAIGTPTGDFTLSDSAGRAVSFAALRGRPLLVQFVYTGCFEACPLATASLAKAVRAARAALGEDSFAVASIGFNQPFDSPEAMADFARRYALELDDWHFLSPAAADVESLTASFGFVHAATPKGFDHIEQVTVVDGAGRIHRQLYGEDVELQALVGTLKELRGGELARPTSLADVWARVKLYCTVYDPAAGRYRVDYSLFFELFAGLSVLAALGWLIVHEWRRADRA